MGGLHPRPCWSEASTEPKSKASLPLRRMPPRRRPRGRRARTHPAALNGTRTRLASVLGSATHVCSALERSRRDHLQNRFSGNDRYALVSPLSEISWRCGAAAADQHGLGAGLPPAPGRHRRRDRDPYGAGSCTLGEDTNCHYLEVRAAPRACRCSGSGVMGIRVGRGTSVRLPKLALDATWS